MPGTHATVRNLLTDKIVSATDFARQDRAVLDQMMAEREPVTVERNGRALAHLTPATREITAREALTDLYGILGPTAGKS